MSKYKVCPELLAGLYANVENHNEMESLNHARECVSKAVTKTELGFISNYALAMLCMEKQCAKYNQCAGKKS